ncbi:hypothetical protein SRHO_G00270950 [Serrasalmus rhombeus]
MESGEDLYFAFRMMRQQHGERLSEFLKRLERALTKTVQRGGLPATSVDKVRVEQLLRGAVDSDLMLLQLRLRERKNNPPSFLKLLNEIKDEEEFEVARQRMNPPSRRSYVRTVQTSEDARSELEDLKELRTEIKMLISKVGDQTCKQSRASTTDVDARASQTKGTSKGQESEVQLLQRQVQELQAQLTVMAIQQTHSPSFKMDKRFKKFDDSSESDRPKTVGQPAKSNETFFCYRCGEDGHIATTCKAPENLSKVIQKLIRALHKQRNEKRESTEKPADKNCVVRKSIAKTTLTSGLPQCLVGPSSTISVKLQVLLYGVLASLTTLTVAILWWTLNFQKSYQELISHFLSWRWSALSPGQLIRFQLLLERMLTCSKGLLICVRRPQTPAPPIRSEYSRCLLKLCVSKPDTDGLVGKVKWIGPGSLSLAPRGERHVACSIELLQTLSKEILLDEWDVGLAKGVEHHILLSDTRPFRERSRRIAPADIDDVRRHLQELLAAGIIKKSRSPYASPIVIARKKNGSVRMCVDYRTLNYHTIPDQYTMPRIDDALDSLSGSKWFSVLDLWSGYYQIAMAEEDKEKTAFICPLGFFQFQRMPQGIMGVPATFQRLMEKDVGDMHLLQVIVYLDDIIVFGKSLEEHEERLLKVLDRLAEVGLKISIDKCQFCQPEVKFIANYSVIVRPLTELTKGYPPTQCGRKNVKDKTKVYFRESEPFGERWDGACTEAFHKIIHCLTHAPVLAFADPSKPYTLHVDASLNGLGAVLYQQYPEGMRPVAFASRKLSTSEQHYPVHQLEFLALKWAVVDKFHDYLYGARFTVRTDNNPLTYVLTTARLNATGHRWLASLATYNFNVQYRRGTHNVDADVLSRNPPRDSADEWTEISQHGIQALCKPTRVIRTPEDMNRLVDQLGAPPQIIPEAYAYPATLTLSSLEHLSRQDIQKAQEMDPVIGAVRQEMITANVLDSPKSDNSDVARLRRESAKLTMKDGILHRVVKKPCGKDVLQLVLPEIYRTKVLKSLHDECGHLGIDRTTELVKDRFYWPRMSMEIEQYIKTCGRCVAGKTLPQRASPLNQITSTGPLDLVCMDFLTVDPDSKGATNVLIVTDHFTSYASLKNDATNYSPYFLMFGRESRLPVDICFGTSPDGESEVHYEQYITKMRQSLKEAYQLASQAASKSHHKNKARYDQRVRHQPLEEGDKVLLRNVGLTGKHKLQDRWRSLPHVVVGKMPNLPVYHVKPERGTGPVKTLHRDHLLPIGYLVRMPEPSGIENVPQRSVTRVQRQRDRAKTVESCETGGETAESKSEEVYQPPQIDVKDVRRRLGEMLEPSDRIDVVEGGDLALNNGELDKNTDVGEMPNSTNLENAGTEEISQPPTNTGVDPDVEGGDVPDSNVLVEDVEPVCTRSSRRERRPVIRLSYDEPGEPTDCPVTIIHNGMIIQFSDSSGVPGISRRTSQKQPVAVCSVCSVRLRPCNNKTYCRRKEDRAKR